MANSLTLKLCAAFLLALTTMACGGGGGGGGGGTSPPPPPPPPPPPGVFRPQIFMEADVDGAPNIRVLEQVYDPFAPGTAQRVLNNLTVSTGLLTGSQTTAVNGARMNNERIGVQMEGSGVLSVYDMVLTDFNGFGSIHGAAIKIQRDPTAAATYIQRVYSDFLEQPDASYNISNTDFLGVEFNGTPIYVRGATGRNFGDAGVDTKSTGVYLMNVTLERANRMLRSWDGTEITIVNSIINAPSGFSQAWLFDNTSSIRYYNTIWCVDAVNPSPTNPACTTAPTLVEGEQISGRQAATRITQLTSNPLPAVTPFFATQIDRIVVEYSTNAGATWQAMALPNAGGGGLPAPIGDTRYRIPFNLGGADYRFRAWVERSGARVGEYSVVINEAGQVVP